MKKHYCIASVKDVAASNLDCVQLTLNDRIFPAKRNIVGNLESQLPYTPDVVVHYDFIYIISRFSMFTESVKKAVIGEVENIMCNAERLKIKGIVMHTDFPFSRELRKDFSKVDELYTASIWDRDSIKALVETPCAVVNKSIMEFNSRLSESLPTTCKIYLENTTKICGEVGTTHHLEFLLKRKPCSSKVLWFVY